MEPELVLTLWVRVDEGVMTMKGYFILPKCPELELYHQMQFSIIPRTVLFGGLTLLQEIQSAYFKSH